MAAAALYTLAPFEKLQDAGFTQPQAHAILNAALETHNTAELATKDDLEKLEIRLDSKIDNVRLATKGDLEKLEIRLDSKIDKVRTDLEHTIKEVCTGLSHRIDNLHKDFCHLASTLGSRLTIRLGAIVVSTATFLPYLTKFLHLPLP